MSRLSQERIRFSLRWLSMNVRVKVVLKRTVVDSD